MTKTTIFFIGLKDIKLLCQVAIKFLFSLFFFLSTAAPTTYGGSQARGQIGAAAAGLHHSYSQARSETLLEPTLQLAAKPDP